jgi:hypothetical protein
MRYQHPFRTMVILLILVYRKETAVPSLLSFVQSWARCFLGLCPVKITWLKIGSERVDVLPRYGKRYG